MFSTLQNTNFVFLVTSNLSWLISNYALNLDKAEILSFGNGFNSLKTQPCLLTTPTVKRFENIVEKGENAGNHNVFYPSQNIFQNFSHIYFVVHVLSIWTSLQFCYLVKR